MYTLDIPWMPQNILYNITVKGLSSTRVSALSLSSSVCVLINFGRLVDGISPGSCLLHSFTTLDSSLCLVNNACFSICDKSMRYLELFLCCPFALYLSKSNWRSVLSFGSMDDSVFARVVTCIWWDDSVGWGDVHVPGTVACPGEQTGDVHVPDTFAGPGEQTGDVHVPGTVACPGEQTGDVHVPGCPGEQTGNVHVPGTFAGPGKLTGDVHVPGTFANRQVMYTSLVVLVSRQVMYTSLVVLVRRQVMYTSLAHLLVLANRQVMYTSLVVLVSRQVMYTFLVHLLVLANS